jgi:hypothetical protein
MVRAPTKNPPSRSSGRGRPARAKLGSSKSKDPYRRKQTMDKLVKQVTVVQGSGTQRKAKVVYVDSQEDYPTFPMDDIVKCVTVIRGSGPTREAKVIFRSPYWADRNDSWQSFERGVRRFLKADLVRAQEAYNRHVDSARDAGKTWWLDIPANIAKSFIKAEEQVREEKRQDKVKDEIKNEVKGG